MIIKQVNSNESFDAIRGYHIQSLSKHDNLSIFVIISLRSCYQTKRTGVNIETVFAIMASTIIFHRDHYGHPELPRYDR